MKPQSTTGEFCRAQMSDFSVTSTMKNLIHKFSMSVLIGCAVLASACRSEAQALATVDPAQTWSAYLSWSPMPGDASGYGGSGASSWGAAALQAVFVGNTNLVLSPNTNVYNPASQYWVNADGSGANNMDASFYVQNDSLVNQNLTFTGLCLSNNLAGGYTSQAFIKVFNSSYTLLAEVTSGLVEGQSFLISTSSIPGAAHVQYGFETVGPDANPATASSLGQVVVAVPVGAKLKTDPSKSWAGYMNCQPVNPGSAFGGYGGSSWGTAALQAYFSTTNLYLLPNTNVYDPANPYWVDTDDGSGANLMDANFYVTDDTLANTNVIFTGYCETNSLTNSFTAQAFIKIFDGSYTYLGGTYSGNLIPGQSFSINLDTTGATHVQYGFVTDGPNINPTNLASFGEAVIAASAPVVPPPVWLVPTNNAPTPTQPSASVLCMYNSSGVYANTPGINWFAGWSGAAGSFFTITNTGRSVILESNLQYGGVEFYDPNQIDASSYNTLHFDLWTPNANQFGIQLVSLNPTVAPQVDFSPAGGMITSNHWIGIDIPLSAFTTANPSVVMSDLQQLLWIDNEGGGGVQGGIFYIDNVYFYTATPSPMITSSMSAGSLNLSFPTQNGFNYTIQYKTNLTDAVWQTLTSVSGNGSPQSFADPAGQGTRFYRLSVQ